jgi:hypothetical protein
MFELSLDGLKTEIRAKLGSNLIRNPFFVKDAGTSFAAAWERSDPSRVTLGTPSSSGSCELILGAGCSITQTYSQALNSGNDSLVLPEFAFSALAFPTGSDRRLILDILTVSNDPIVRDIELSLGDGGAYYMATTSLVLPTGTKDFKIRLRAPGSTEIRLRLICLTPGALQPSFFVQHAITEADLQNAIGDIQSLLEVVNTNLAAEVLARTNADTHLENTKHERSGTETHTGDWTNTGSFTVQGSTSLGATTIESVVVSSTATFNGAATFNGTSTFTGPVSFTGTVTVGDSASDSLTVNSSTTFVNQLKIRAPQGPTEAARLMDIPSYPSAANFVQTGNVDQYASGVKTFARLKSDFVPVDPNDVARKADLGDIGVVTGALARGHFLRVVEGSDTFSNLNTGMTESEFINKYFWLNAAGEYLEAAKACTILVIADAVAKWSWDDHGGNLSTISYTLNLNKNGNLVYSKTESTGFWIHDLGLWYYPRCTPRICTILSLKKGELLSLSTNASLTDHNFARVSTSLEILVLPTLSETAYINPPLRITDPYGQVLNEEVATGWTGTHTVTRELKTDYPVVGAVWTIESSTGPDGYSASISGTTLSISWVSTNTTTNYTTAVRVVVRCTDSIGQTQTKDITIQLNQGSGLCRGSDSPDGDCQAHGTVDMPGTQCKTVSTSYVN